MKKYLCIHCHYYQPPRENPWLEDIVLQESAYPYHDWNERINHECYRANAQSRIKDDDDYVIRVVNNYAKISFNFGPTLLSWLEEKDPLTYQGILGGDRLSQEKFGGHGSALAQAYNHMILPLANRRDKETQVRWGLRDFERRFGRPAAGLWLPETAVDYESLEVIAEHGVKFVILAPHQARAFRRKGDDGAWTEVSHQGIDPSQAYDIPLGGGRSIVAFFYDGPISRAVAFEGLLHNGEGFARRLLSGYDDKRNNGAQLLHIATDGETYGHHHAHGDMALAYALAYVEEKNLAQVVNYGQFLELHPPQCEAQIHPNSAWSCMHGIERWRSNCGCSSGMRPQWHQKWRAPLREAFDELREQVSGPFEQKMKAVTDDPWAMRDGYVDVIMDRSDSQLIKFFEKHCPGKMLSADETELTLKLLEMQRHLLLMYTSCAWFFDDISGIETVQSLQYAYRALELAEETLNLNLEERFRGKLALAPSNTKEVRHGGEVFERFVKPSRVDFLTMGVHFAISSLFNDYQAEQRIGSYFVSVLKHQKKDLGRAKMAVGQAQVRSLLTREQKHLLYGVVHFGDHNVNAGAKLIYTQQEFNDLAKDITASFERADFIGALHTLYHYFDEPLYTIKDLFKDEQKNVIDQILGKNLGEVEDRLVGLYDSNYPLTSYLSGLSVPLPMVFRHIAEFVQNRSLEKALNATPGSVDIPTIKKFLEEAERWGTKLDQLGLAHLFEDSLERMVAALRHHMTDKGRIEQIIDFVDITKQLAFGIDSGPAQNQFYFWCQSELNEQLNNMPLPAEERYALQKLYRRLADALMVRIPILNTF